MSASISATATVAGTANGAGGYNYSVTLNDTGATAIGTFWFGWIPGQDFLTQNPSAIGFPSGWTDSIVAFGGGYSIEWSANSAANYIQPGGSSFAFTFSSAETPAMLGANSTLAPTYPSTTSYVYAAAPFVSSGVQITPVVGGAATPMEAATATLTPLQVSPGVFQYTVSLTDTGNTNIGTFWFAWDDVPDQDLMSVLPTNVGSPAGWTDAVTSHVYPDGTGYGIEWSSGSVNADMHPGDVVSAFTFTSTETPQQLAGPQIFNDPSFNTVLQSTSSFVYSGGAEQTAGGNLIVAVACFRGGTRIRTPSGDVAVETLRAGDPVVTAAGERRPLRWVGSRYVRCSDCPDPRLAWPVRIAKDALEPGVPAADLYLSPDHALFLDGVLVPVKHLVNGGTVACVPADEVTWYHLELDRHDVLLAEGAPAESYLDIGDRGKFDGEAPAWFSAAAGNAAMLREARSAMKIVVTGPELAAIRLRLAGRAGAADAAGALDRADAA